MNVCKTCLAAAVVVGMVGAAPAYAQHRGGGHSGGGGQSRGGGSGPESHGGGVSRGAPRAYSSPRVYEGPRGGFAGGRAVPRGGGRSYGYYGGGRSYGYNGGARSYGYYGGGRSYGYYAPRNFYRPYYTFRPRVSLGFGFFAGVPVPYPYFDYYSDPYYYGAPYAYPSYGSPSSPRSSYPPATYPPAGYPQQPSYPPGGWQPTYQPAPGSVGVQPGDSNTGGVSFDVSPSTAEVFVDGQNVGTVDQFTAPSQALGLTPGRHRIEIRAPGYQSMSFDADVVAGQVIPYQGTLQTR